MTRYDSIGASYARTRRADPRIARRIETALGDARRVVNVGAGTGNYEPAGRRVVAVEPSRTMLAQRPAGAAPAVQAAAEHLPFSDHAFDAALAVLTVHHWSDLGRGLREMQRVAPRQVVFYFEPSFAGTLWLIDEYFPEITALQSERAAPDGGRLAARLGVERIEVVPVPADCVDGFGGCFWNRPEAYLDPVVQMGMSSFAQLDPAVRAAGTEALRRDLASGAWDERHGALRALDEIDLGYRLLVAALP
ncbi:MAG TPA: class I SAM-dependent methyltransferase [Acidimicrobiia bacterium]|nr:class I SAM-dependent methyltransferase [Acidimicrobiia bacterium]